jgi:hypothetical protein
MAIKGMGGPIASEEACMDIYAYFVVGAAVALLLVLDARTIIDIRKRTRRLRRLETKLDLLKKGRL